MSFTVAHGSVLKTKSQKIANKNNKLKHKHVMTTLFPVNLGKKLKSVLRISPLKIDMVKVAILFKI